MEDILGLWKLGFPCVFWLVYTPTSLYWNLSIQEYVCEFLKPVILEPEESSPSQAAQVTEMGPLKKQQC